MSYWHVSNHKLYSGSNSTDVSNPKFIVGTEFAFDNDTFIDPLSSAYSGIWTGSTPKANRTNAGNTVFMWGNWFGMQTAQSGAQRMLSCFSQNPGLEYYIPNIDECNYTDPNFNPRGQHSYLTNQNTYVKNGHWIKLPTISFLDDAAVTDITYINQWSNYPSYWNQNTNLDGTEQWHTAWLSAVMSGSVNGNYYSNKIAAWYLMDEPFNSNWHRDYASNQFSVSGHSAFCATGEGSQTRPKMVGPGGNSCESDYTAMSGTIGIFAGNAYGGSGITTNAWYTPNMVAWMYSKISNSSTKMIIPWLWGRYSDISLSKYVFYGSLIEGARGVIWWMKSNDYPALTPDYSSYAHQTNIYSNFINNISFNNVPRPDDRGIFLSGTELPVANYSVNHNNTYTAYNYYPQTITKATSIKAFSYLSNDGSTRWRIYAVNHSNVSVGLTAEISGIAPSLTAYIKSSTSYVTTTNLPNGSNRITDNLAATSCRIYDVGN